MLSNCGDTSISRLNRGTLCLENVLKFPKINHQSPIDMKKKSDYQSNTLILSVVAIALVAVMAVPFLLTSAEDRPPGPEILRAANMINQNLPRQFVPGVTISHVTPLYKAIKHHLVLDRTPGAKINAEAFSVDLGQHIRKTVCDNDKAKELFGMGIDLEYEASGEVDDVVITNLRYSKAKCLEPFEFDKKSNEELLEFLGAFPDQ